MFDLQRSDSLAGLGLAGSKNGSGGVLSTISNLLSNFRISASVPTPVGPVVLDSKNTGSIKQVAASVRDALSRTQVQVSAGNTPPAQESPADFVQNRIPGGWVTVAVGGAAALALLAMLMSRSKARAR